MVPAKASEADTGHGDDLREPDLLGAIGSVATSNDAKNQQQASKSWREVLPVHPAAELFPPLPDDELVALGEDIRTRGLLHPITILTSPEGNKLLDGRSRLDAMERAGIWFSLHRGKWDWYFDVDDVPVVAHPYMVSDIDPYAYVVSVNIRRRHLTRDQTNNLIAKLLKLDPTKSDRQIAKAAHVSPTTVGTIRKKIPDVSNLDTRTDSKGRQQPASKPGKPKIDQDRPDDVQASASAMMFALNCIDGRPERDAQLVECLTIKANDQSRDLLPVINRVIALLNDVAKCLRVKEVAAVDDGSPESLRRGTP